MSSFRFLLFVLRLCALLIELLFELLLEGAADVAGVSTSDENPKPE